MKKIWKKIIKKKKKGFTLIELLAIIVILAIIMIVTIPTVLTSLNDVKTKQLKNATSSVADWLEKQYQIEYVGGNFLADELSSAYKSWDDNLDKCDGQNCNPITLTKEILEDAGIGDVDKNIDIDKSSVYYDVGLKKMCVKLVAKTGGDLYGNNNTNNTEYSSGCSQTFLDQEEEKREQENEAIAQETKKQEFNKEADKVANWLYEQTKIYEEIQAGVLSQIYIDWYNSDDAANNILNNEVLKAAGITNPENDINIAQLDIYDVENPLESNPICVIITPKEAGNFYILLPNPPEDPSGLVGPYFYVAKSSVCR